jgi:hypothetical protein
MDGKSEFCFFGVKAPQHKIRGRDFRYDPDERDSRYINQFLYITMVFAVFFLKAQTFLSGAPAPGRKVILDSHIGRHNLKDLADLQFLYLLSCLDDRHRA